MDLREERKNFKFRARRVHPRRLGGHEKGRRDGDGEKEKRGEGEEERTVSEDTTSISL
jgi:hypothetical protein